MGVFYVDKVGDNIFIRTRAPRRGLVLSPCAVARRSVRAGRCHPHDDGDTQNRGDRQHGAPRKGEVTVTRREPWYYFSFWDCMKFAQVLRGAANRALQTMVEVEAAAAASAEAHHQHQTEYAEGDA